MIMSNENYTVEVREDKCFCKSKGFKKFLINALGSFVGVFLALSLFAALHKPPMPMPMPCPCGCQGGYHHVMMRHHHNHHFDRGPKGPRGEFHKKMIKENPQVKVEIDD